MKWLGLTAKGQQEAGVREGVYFRSPEDEADMRKAEKTTNYTLNGYRFRIKAGDVIPEGAVLDDERGKKAAPENRAEKSAPTNRSKSNTKKGD